jgi:hypothetical protein
MLNSFWNIRKIILISNKVTIIMAEPILENSN